MKFNSTVIRPILMGLLLLFLDFSLSAQSYNKMIEMATTRSNITATQGDSVFNFYVLLGDRNKKVKAKSKRFYLYFANSELKRNQGAFNGKLLNGEFKRLTRSGDLREKGKIDKGLKEGVWQYWHPNGTLASEVNWKEGVKYGKFKSFYPNGQVKEEGKYKNKTPDTDFKVGTYTLYDGQGRLVRKGKYKKNQFYGNEYQHQDEKSEKIELIADQPKPKQGTFKHYYDDGQIKQKGQYKNGKLHGIINEYDKNGNVQKYIYREGLNLGKHGYQEEYYSDGKLKLKGNYRLGKLEGEAEEYAQQGAMKTYLYKDGERVYLNGRFTETYPDGTIKKKGNHFKGKLSGWVKEYKKNGDLSRKIRYKAGEEVEQETTSKTKEKSIDKKKSSKKKD